MSKPRAHPGACPCRWRCEKRSPPGVEGREHERDFVRTKVVELPARDLALFHRKRGVRARPFSGADGAIESPDQEPAQVISRLAPGTACPGTGCEYAIRNCEYPSGTEVCVGVANIAPVGAATLGAGLWGQLDLTGDVSEWTLDWYAPYVQCTDFAAASYRVLRGGDFGFIAHLPPFRDNDAPASRESDIGFRCSRSP